MISISISSTKTPPELRRLILVSSIKSPIVLRRLVTLTGINDDGGEDNRGVVISMGPIEILRKITCFIVDDDDDDDDNDDDDDDDDDAEVYVLWFSALLLWLSMGWVVRCSLETMNRVSS